MIQVFIGYLCFFIFAASAMHTAFDPLDDIIFVTIVNIFIVIFDVAAHALDAFNNAVREYLVPRAGNTVAAIFLGAMAFLAPALIIRRYRTNKENDNAAKMPRHFNPHRRQEVIRALGKRRCI